MKKASDYSYVLLLTNQQRFAPDVYEPESPIINESMIEWLNLPLMPTRWYFDVEHSEVGYDDNYFFSLSGVTETVQEIKQLNLSKTESNNDGFFTQGEFVL